MWLLCISHQKVGSQQFPSVSLSAVLSRELPFGKHLLKNEWRVNPKQLLLFLKHLYQGHCFTSSQNSAQRVTNSHNASLLPVAVDWFLDLSRLFQADLFRIRLLDLKREGLPLPKTATLDCLFLVKPRSSTNFLLIPLYFSRVISIWIFFDHDTYVHMIKSL